MRDISRLTELIFSLINPTFCAVVKTDFFQLTSCVNFGCSCREEIEQLKSEILPIRIFFKEEIENLNVVFSSLKREASNSTKPINDRLVQHLFYKWKRNSKYRLLFTTTSKQYYS